MMNNLLSKKINFFLKIVAVRDKCRCVGKFHITSVETNVNWNEARNSFFRSQRGIRKVIQFHCIFSSSTWIN